MSTCIIYKDIVIKTFAPGDEGALQGVPDDCMFVRITGKCGNEDGHGSMIVSKTFLEDDAVDSLNEYFYQVFMDACKERQAKYYSRRHVVTY